MVVTVGTITYGAGTGIGDSNYTLEHTVATGTKVLVIGVAVSWASGNGATSAKWNTTPATLAVSRTGSGRFAGILYVVNPVVGTYNIVVHDDNDAGSSGGPQIYAANLSGDVGTASPVGDTHSQLGVDVAYTFQGDVGAQFDIFFGDTFATVDVASTTIFESVAIGTDKCAASYRLHSGTDFTTDHSADPAGDFYAGAEFKNGNDLVTLQIINV